MQKLPEEFLNRPIAHRAFHDDGETRAENNFRAIEAAIEAGYAIEIDVQPSRDGEAMVFHDYHLSGLTDGTGAIAQSTVAELSKLKFRSGEIGIPTLEAVLNKVAGRAPILIEIKDQDGAMGPHVGALDRTVAKVLSGYEGLVALMSFNPHSIAQMAELCPDIPRGLTTCGFLHDEWIILREEMRNHLRAIPDYDRVEACFISHQWADLASERVAELKSLGARVLSWTVRNPQQEEQARAFAENITFEGYVPT